MKRFLGAALIVLAGAAGRPLFAQDPPGMTVLTGGVDEYVVRPGDTVASLRARFGADTVTLLQLNKLDKARPLVAGRVLTIDNRHIAVIEAGASIAINIAQRMLYHFDGESVTAYPIAVGVARWPTPLGAFTVIDKEEHPTWDVPLSIQEEMRRQGKPVVTHVPPSPANPLGDYWIRLSFSSVGIHGTNQPLSLYRYASHGCIRLHPEDVAALFPRVSIGTAGVIRYQPVLIASIDGRVYLESHPDVYRGAPDPLQFVRSQTGGFGDQVDWTAVQRVLKAQRGVAVDVTKND